MASLGPEQINMLTSLSDPAKLAKLKEAGLPTVDLSKIKEAAEKRLQAAQQEMVSSLSNSVSTLMESADKMIRTKVEEAEKLAKMASKLPNGSAALTEVQDMIAKLKQAKEHGLASGNFVPLLAHLHPDVNLKGLSKDTVVLPKLPGIPTLPKLP